MLDKINLESGDQFVVGNILAYNSIFKTWSIEHYTKCSFRCTYCCCDSQGKSVVTVDPERLIELIDADIEKASQCGLFFPKQTKIILCCHTDPYVDIESKLRLTRAVIEHLVAIQQPFSIVTRGVIIQRDLDLLEKFKEHCEVSFSLPIINPEHLKRFEPHTPPIEERINTIFTIHDAGIKTTIRISPWIPGATDVEEIIQCLPSNADVLISPLMLSDIFNVDSIDKAQLDDLIKRHQGQDDLLFNKYTDFSQNGFCQTATRLFSHLSQSDINHAYIQERNKVGFRPHVKWFYPPSVENNIYESALRFLKPGEILL